MALENVVNAIYDGSTEFEGIGSETKISLGSIFEGISLTSSYLFMNLR